MERAENDRRIDYIEFRVTDIVAAKKFYEEVFGWGFRDYGEDYTSFYDGRLGGGLWTAAEVQKGGPLVVIYAANLEGTRDKIVSVGGSITKDIFSFPGGRRFHFTDPSGNELAVWSE